jgi:hypothetical protein
MRIARTGGLLVALMFLGTARGGEPCCPPPEGRFLDRIRPVGGCDPYGGGLLHWWNPHWFPHSGSPDAYNRKPAPHFLWQSYAPYYAWGPLTGCAPAAQANREH